MKFFEKNLLMEEDLLGIKDIRLKREPNKLIHI